MSRSTLSRRQFVTATALTSATLIAAPYVRGAHAADCGGGRQKRQTGRRPGRILKAMIFLLAFLRAYNLIVTSYNELLDAVNREKPR